MAVTLDYISNNLAVEQIKVPQQVSVVDQTVRYTPEVLRELYKRENKIFVLDFHVLFSKQDISSGNVKHLLGPDGEILGLVDDSSFPAIINIDHHSQHPSFASNISTTHQALIFSKCMPHLLDQFSPILVNHVDTDSVLSVLALTNPELPPLLQIAFAHAAIAADHTGEFNEIVVLMDSLYKMRDIHLSMNTLIKFLKSGFMPDWITEKYEIEIQRLKLSDEIVRQRQFVDLGEGVILINRSDGDRLQTAPFPELFKKYGIPCSMVIIANPMYGKFAFNVRSCRDFPIGHTLQEASSTLNLQRFGYGGRANAGGNDRMLGDAEFILPNDFGSLFVEYFEKLRSDATKTDF